jgi:intracellular multiplication protein IcmB
MSLTNKLYHSVESLFAWISSAIKQNALSYCDLETADSQQVLVSKDGSLLSIIKLHGYKRFVGANEYAYLCERLSEMFQPAFSGTGHLLQFFFNYELDTVKSSLEKALTPARRTAKRLELDIDDIFDSRVKTLADFCGDESTFIVLWTTPLALEKSHLKVAHKHHANEIKKAPINLREAKSAQNIFNVLPELRNMHESFINTILEDIQHAGYYADLLEVHKALNEVRQTIDPNVTDESWSPFLPGDSIPVRMTLNSEGDAADLLWPPLDGQLMPRDAENLDLKIARIGDRIYAPVFVELFPKDIKPFYELFRRMIQSSMPWRISFFMAPSGIDITKSKSWLAQFLTFSSHYNKLLVDSHRMLKYMHERSDNPIIKLYVTLATWAPEKEMELLKERVAKLVKAVQSWGSCEVREISGDPFASTLSSALAVTNKIQATASAAPLSEAISMMPLVRPASPWLQGALLFRTPDGKIWPYQPGSNHQVSWIDIIYARSGSGKSVLLSTLNLGLCLLAGLSNLPRLAIVDIGPSSKGFISLLQGGLPKEKQKQVKYHRLTLDEKDAINPFDTQVGSRFPTQLHRSFLINFLSLLLVDNISDRPPEGMGSMLSMVVDETYKRFSDDGQPKVFVPDSDAEIQAGLTKHQIDLKSTRQTTWWQISDALFEKGEFYLALKAQRYAMPTLADTISLAHVNTIKDLFADVKTTTGEGYVESYSRIMSGVIRNYPTLTTVTHLNIEGARVVALDLDEVAKSGSASAEKQTAMMYMLARHVLAQDFFLSAEEIERFPLQYHQHHRTRLKEIMEEPKRIVFDEFHRTSNSPAVRDQVLQDMREGRKWKIHVALSSQSLRDFDKLMIEFATSIFILDSGAAMSIDATCETFGLTDTEKVALSTRVHGPTSVGSTFIAQFVTKRGMNTQLLTSTISPVELWAFNTTTEDVRIRDTLYEEIGPVATRKLLARRFPKGSATDEIEQELKRDPTTTISKVCQQYIDQLRTEFKRQQRNSSTVSREE